MTRKPLEIKPQELSPLLSYTACRKAVGDVPRSTFDSWIAAGILVPVAIGPRRKFIRREDLERLIQGGAQVAK